MRSLTDACLEINCRMDQAHALPDIHTPNALSFGYLSSLTGLQHLQLDSTHYERCDLRWSDAADADSDRLLWQQHSLAQHGALVAALRHMPHLGSFESCTLTLSVSDLAALTSLKRVRVGGLLPPEPPLQQQGAALVPGSGVRPGQHYIAGVPHPLQELEIGDDACSPRALACLGIFPRLRKVETMLCEKGFKLAFGPADSGPGGAHLLPDIPQAVQQAMRTLADVRARGCLEGAGRPLWNLDHATLLITADAGLHPLLPPAPAPFPPSPAAGHAAWLRELRPFGVPGQGLQLWGLALAPGDLACIAGTFPEAKVGVCAMPPYLMCLA